MLTDLESKMLEALKSARVWKSRALHELMRPKIDEAIAAAESRALAPQATPLTALKAKRVVECLQVLRPKVKGKWPHEQALEELAELAAVTLLQVQAVPGEDAKDAARYRHLRGIDNDSGCAIFEMNEDGSPKPFGILIGGHADDFIDVAMLSAAPIPEKAA